MASETLSIPEEHLAEVIRVIRAGIAASRKDKQVSRETLKQLAKWCAEQEEYLNAE